MCEYWAVITYPCVCAGVEESPSLVLCNKSADLCERPATLYRCVCATYTLSEDSSLMARKNCPANTNTHRTWEVRGHTLLCVTCLPCYFCTDISSFYKYRTKPFSDLQLEFDSYFWLLINTHKHTWKHTHVCRWYLEEKSEEFCSDVNGSLHRSICCLICLSLCNDSNIIFACCVKRSARRYYEQPSRSCTFILAWSSIIRWRSNAV